ncbi:hypothetical protein GCM10017774_89880 [Lentzea cavernae]|uniref:Uncharacterized protein n=2 Tax=Lentzea cavernae TaxID=2020703 RepID=A0ABQ3MWS1_9PSEU|nr:hypothetical protein GCM10017774_89880 [Lentzea cavernae]
MLEGSPQKAGEIRKSIPIAFGRFAMSKIVSTVAAGAATLLTALAVAASVSGGVAANADDNPPPPPTTTTTENQDGHGNPWHG